jgi:OTU domain-containing protein 6
MDARHKKEFKALDTENRAAVKKIKSTAGKGKRCKDLLAVAAADYEQKLKELLHKQTAELLLAGSDLQAATSLGSEDVEVETAVATAAGAAAPPPPDCERQRNQAKARRKREKAREKERERERQIVEETSNAGPSQRDLESDAIQQHLKSMNLAVRQVAADGHCLYRALAAQSGGSVDYQEMRKLLFFWCYC